MYLKTRARLAAWQLAVLVLGSSWLFAPYLNQNLSYRTGLISQFELPGQPYAWLFRLCDILAALLILSVGLGALKHRSNKVAAILLAVIGAGLLLDPVFSTTCKIQDGVCNEYVSLGFLLHALETVSTSAAVFILASYDSIKRKRLFSTMFVIFQILYGILFITQLATQDRFNTLAQFAYETTLIFWLVWFVRDFFADVVIAKSKYTQIIKQVVALWAFVNGIVAILISLADINVVGRLHGLYFAGDNAWLAQHSIVVGIVLIYISRHLLRGERRARHLFMMVALVEVLKYSDVTPHPGLLVTYLLTLIGLFTVGDTFDRGPQYLTWRLRVKEVAFAGISLIIVSAIGFFFLHTSTPRVKIINRSIDHFFDYTLREDFRHTHRESVLLAHTLSTFVIGSGALFLWILFRPAKPKYFGVDDKHKAEDLLINYSSSSEDYFKIWPGDKNYYFGSGGFIAYKVVGPIAFALADPIAPNNRLRSSLLASFIRHCRDNGWRTCFLMVSQQSRDKYEQQGLNIMQIGSSAVIDIDSFIQTTSRDKWWRWQNNRALKQGYQYYVSLPPHSNKLINELRKVSDSWLSKDGREERSFALGYFDEEYLRQCKIHYLTQDSEVIAFVNEMPLYNNLKTASIDLMRHKADANNAMPYLISQTIGQVADQNYKYFDLGFVPFAATRSTLIRIIKALSNGRFSSSGLEQFKNKFDPQWQGNYIAYDGDIADLALIAINVEKAMQV